MQEKHFSDTYLKLVTNCFFMVLPILCALLLLLLWENIDFLWAAPLFGSIGWILMFSSTYLTVPSAKQPLAIEIFYATLIAVVALCAVLIPLKHIGLSQFLEPQSSQTPALKSGQDSQLPKDNTQKDLEKLHMHIQVIEQMLQEVIIKERENH
jgi:hypothetical protein